MPILHDVRLSTREISLRAGVNGVEVRVACPVESAWVEIGCCVGCDHYRGLTTQVHTGRRVHCRASARLRGNRPQA